MAKRRGRRDLEKSHPIANDPLSVLLTPNPVYALPTQPLALIEDQRFFHPDGDNRPVMSIGNLPINRIEAAPNVDANRKSQRGFRPLSVRGSSSLVFGRDAVGNPAVRCVRRQVRKEVLFAKGKGGSRKPRRVKRNRYSSIGC